MYEDDARVRRTISLLRAQQEASIDGILVVNEQRKMVSCNKRFLEMWGIPDEVARTNDDDRMIGHVLGKLRHPDRFVARVMHLYAHPDETSRDEIELLDGRTFDRYSAPAIGEEGEHFGRVWLFRDMTARRRAEAALDDANHRLRAALTELEERDEALRADLEHARAFQQSILPALPARDGLELDVVYRPADRVGGDLYHAAMQGSWLRLIVADATGHGVTAALSTMLLRGEYEAAREVSERPGGVLAALNARILTYYGGVGMRFTALCADLDVETGELRWSSAAHPAPLRVAGGDVTELATGGPFVGIAADAQFPEWSVRLAPGDAVCLITDGITEAPGAGGEQLGEARLADALAAADRAGAPLAAAVSRAVDAFVGAAGLADDATVLAVRWRGPRA
jgi:serine phosphatase RsbU (regulator of sigma subunit)